MVYVESRGSFRSNFGCMKGGSFYETRGEKDYCLAVITRQWLMVADISNK